MNKVKHVSLSKNKDSLISKYGYKKDRNGSFVLGNKAFTKSFTDKIKTETPFAKRIAMIENSIYSGNLVEHVIYYKCKRFKQSFIDYS